MRSGRMGPMGNDTRGREKWRVRGNGPVMGKLGIKPRGRRRRPPPSAGAVCNRCCRKAQRICLDGIFVDEGLGRRVVAQIHFQAQLLQAKALHEIIDLMLLLAPYILGGITRDGGAGPVVETHAMSSDQEAGVEIDFDDAVDAALIKVEVLARGYRHERVWREAFMVYARLQLPF